MKLKHKFLFIVLGFLLSLFSVLDAYEVAFLPVNTSGEKPSVLSKKDDLDFGLAELSAFYASENYSITPTEFEKVRDFVLKGKFNYHKKLDKREIAEACEALDSSFVVTGEYLFADGVSVTTEVYNCKGDVVSRKESFLKEAFYASLQKHIKKSFTSFPAKEFNPLIETNTEISEVVFALDFSGSFYKEMAIVKEYLKKQLSAIEIPVGFLVLSSDKTQYYPPTKNKESQLQVLENTKPGGKLDVEKMVIGLYKLKTEKAESKKQIRKLILLSDVRVTKENYHNYQIALKSMKDSGYTVHLITNSANPPSVLLEYKKLAGTVGNNLLQITNSKKIGTTKGFRTVYIQNNHIFYDKLGRNPSPEISIENLTQIEDNKLYAQVDYPHPNNMSKLYSIVTGDKIIEEHPLESDVASIINSLLKEDGRGSYRSYSKVLIKSGSSSIWIQTPIKLNEYKDRFITMKVMFVKDKSSSNGFSSVGSYTQVASNNVPKLLLFKSSEISRYFQTAENKSLVCYIEGKVVEVK